LHQIEVWVWVWNHGICKRFKHREVECYQKKWRSSVHLGG
jgi:hypothetical protein